MTVLERASRTAQACVSVNTICLEIGAILMIGVRLIPEV